MDKTASFKGFEDMFGEVVLRSDGMAKDVVEGRSVVKIGIEHCMDSYNKKVEVIGGVKWCHDLQ
jgi:hypothetical protein